MSSILRGIITYFFVWLIFRIAGKRTLAQITTFDAVLLLIISETTQAALVDTDDSMTNSILLILTMVGIDIILSCIKRRFPTVEHVIDGVPLILFGRQGLNEYALTKERVDEEDILNAARKLQGLMNLDEVEYAILEQTGAITIIPKRKAS
jgi:uncharacterized membrane protein YcaP (DUF421 family)